MPLEIIKRPFGFDPIENEQYVKKHRNEETRCIFVDMLVDHKPFYAEEVNLSAFYQWKPVCNLQ